MKAIEVVDYDEAEAVAAGGAEANERVLLAVDFHLAGGTVGQQLEGVDGGNETGAAGQAGGADS